MSRVIAAHLIEPDRVSEVQVESISERVNFQNAFKVIITNNDKESSYIVDFSDILLASNEHGGYLKDIQNRAYCAIRARHYLKGRSDPQRLEMIQVGAGDWSKFRPQVVGTDLSRDEAESTLIRLLFRVAKEPYSSERSFLNWDLQASLDFQSFEGILFFLKDQGYLERTDGGYWKVTREGFRYFEERVREENKPVLLNVNRYFQRVPIRSKKPFVFVVMPFREDLTPIFTNAIQPTVKEVMTGYDCIRADGDYEPGKIDNKVWTLIQEAEFIIAEITDHNPNVLTELGIALTFGKPVYVFSSKPLDKTLFIDVKTLLAQEYSDAEDLKKKLTAVLPKK